MTWPFPGDSPTARARRVALAYRARLLMLNPAACEALDAQMRNMGQRWVAPTIQAHRMDDWVPPRVAAELAAVELATLREWRRRGRLTGRKRDGRWEYQVRDVLALSTATRRRGSTGL